MIDSISDQSQRLFRLLALTLSGMSHAIAKEETLKTSNGHSKPKTKKTGSKRLVMLDPG
ncbi:hypothetical protein ONQ60_27430, partial [Salmonella enterica subsp. enterica serovar Virginia]|nr:hypothetical protein [Salmonella enterica subsp. enterica serovar Virginia]